ncbi:related to DBP6 - ATP-dependent RNA helicase [Melanopsichium pennsylvanicum]|uniref:ATP-dependent RNA helicase n=2 Tax=Melanopsichium pennsylvanicum TaxID=63383 RepID=A0AAJ4XIE8_9BASI|nr:related to DBP6-ATP-dependent RNA helicase [Melanopsichium pennsylvanicum 4]SNX82286.1 related to DBP6 - ATP-dependent RNA helicase [Melanopsichium pennsylvanicum]
MFSIKRFDAFGGSSSTAGNNHDTVDKAKLDALNERIAKKRRLLPTSNPASASQLATSDPVTNTSVPSTSDNAALSASPAARPSLNIHPSRLNAAPLLRRSVNKAQTGPKEKTKAKARYLKAKKDRRKARIRAAPKKPKTDEDKTAAVADNSIISHLPEEEALHRLEAAKKIRKVQEAKGDNSFSSESEIDQDSDQDSSSESASSAGSDGTGAREGDVDACVNDREVDESEKTEWKEMRALERFPLAGVKKAVDPKLISSLGLPQGLSNRTVVNPTLSRPLPQHRSSKAAVRTMSAPLAPGGGQTIVDEEVSEAQSDDDDSATLSARITNDDFGKVPLSDTVRFRLESLGVSQWFAVQVSVIPTLLAQPRSRSLYRPFAPPRDLCVSSPTGSGKTLAYTVPIVEVLRSRQIVRLRALIVLPTRDLVSQVKSTLELVAKGSGLRIGTATGQHSFAHEQSQLVGLTAGQDEDDEGAQREMKVDILIATPGRLIDHLDSTPGFTLAHLRFLVIDEADRLLNQSFQEWLRRVLAAAEGKTHIIGPSGPAQAPCEILCGTASGLGSAASSTLQEEPVASVQKLLFSATLTRDPAKIAALGLRNPHYITVQDNVAAGNDEAGLSGGQQHERFSLPHSLREHMLVTTSAEKPFHLLYLLHRPDQVDGECKDRINKALVFTKSVDSAARLVKLIEIFEAVRTENGLIPRGGKSLVVQNYSSELKPSDRQRILAQFGKGGIDLLVCSDLISRGIDLPSVEHVISYDAPVDPAKYVHRVGRTARAGKHGDAWTLVEEQEARHFKKMVRQIVRQTPIVKIKPKKIKGDESEIDYVQGDALERELKKLTESYDEALSRMATFYRNE